MFKKCAWSLFVSMLVGAVFAAGVSADTHRPGYEVFGYSIPTVLSPGGTGILHFEIYNVGAAESNEGVTLTDTLPAGLENTGGECSGSTIVTCQLPPITMNGGLPDKRAEVNIFVRVAADASNTPAPVDRVSLMGGGAMSATDATVPVRYGAGPSGPGISNFDAWASNADGTIDTQAGSHPYEFTVAFAPNNYLGNKIFLPSGGEAKAVNVNLPPGLVGEPNGVPQCTRQEFDEGEFAGGEVGGCPPDTQVGIERAGVSAIAPDLTFGEEAGIQPTFNVYNLVPPPGVAAEFGFDFDKNQVFINAKVRSGGDYGITVNSNVPQSFIVFSSTTIWGVPGEHGTGASDKPFLTLPTSCSSQGQFSIEMLGTWQDPEATAPVVSAPYHDNEGTPTRFSGCERLVHFQPTVSLAPDTSFSDTPAGLSATVKVPQGLNPEGLATPGLKETTVVLPEGVVINPGQATGLVACQPSQENIGGPEAEKEVMDGPPSCPAASKVGTDEISTPLLVKRLKGNVYILQSNPPNLELLVAAEGEGVFLKLIGTVHLNEQTGQLTTTFKGTGQDPGTPDAPLTEFILSFSGGAQAALVTPATCGVYTATADFTPWSAPFVENAISESNFSITSGPGGSSTVNCTGPLPFSPSMTAGATTDQAGGYTDFSMLLSRGDGQQRIEKLEFKTPEGLLGMIAKVPLCQEPQAAAGTCSSASQIGHTVAEVGPGPYPFVIPQENAPPAPIYLTGPYEGAPFGLSIAVPIVAGPFNLGTEVVRAKIEVDPHTSQLTISTTAFPKTVKGIPTDIREIDAVIDRPEFMFNPTDCNPMSFSGVATSFEGATAPLSSHFQMGSCRSLAFAPNFKVSTSGKTSRANGASLTAKIVYPTGNLGANQASSQSNIASVKVDLPKQLPSRLTTLQKACTAATFEANPANCPVASIVGHAKAITPVLPVPIEGPAYFVSHAGEEFPSLIAVLQGYGVTVDLVGSTFINDKTNITSSTFKNVPDVPIASFELSLPQGKYSALAGNGNLCKSKLVMPTAFTGQDGAVIHQSTPIAVTGCPKAKKAKKAKTKKVRRSKTKAKKK
jgi:hypothetical protein